jgi:two-component system sensor histidine kinase DesK
VDAVLERDTGPLPGEVEQVVAAVVQEALTNAARHAAPTRVLIDVRRDGDDVVVSVVDSGRMPGDEPAAEVLGTGTGLRGMGERVAAAGGSLTFGGDGAGFRVDARLPLRQAVSA